ncbi:MAG: 50S ribosomal protein L23 [Candidatus Omnitrophica bacterium]|nr:50S ribosomal protein L23 [Candidatus Omnitrophota bacterium]
MKLAYDIIKSIIHTEKSTQLEPAGKYWFLVDRRANKQEIKKAVEDIYKVDVVSVNTFISHGKLKRVRFQAGRTPELKKAIVTLKTGQKIEVT